jgi:hypothetical protein
MPLEPDTNLQRPDSFKRIESDMPGGGLQTGAMDGLRAQISA